MLCNLLLDRIWSFFQKVFSRIPFMNVIVKWVFDPMQEGTGFLLCLGLIFLTLHSFIHSFVCLSYLFVFVVEGMCIDFIESATPRVKIFSGLGFLWREQLINESIWFFFFFSNFPPPSLSGKRQKQNFSLKKRKPIVRIWWGEINVLSPEVVKRDAMWKNNIPTADPLIGP